MVRQKLKKEEMQRIRLLVGEWEGGVGRWSRVGGGGKWRRDGGGGGRWKRGEYKLRSTIQQ